MPVEVAQLFGAVVSSVGLLAGRLPGLKRHVENRLTLSRALGKYRTPANDHLRRALRLSWLRAATALMHDRLSWAQIYPNAEGAPQLVEFAPIFEALQSEIVNKNLRLRDGSSIGPSAIDEHLDLLIDNISAPLAGHELGIDPERLFSNTLAELCGIKESEIPVVLRRAASEGLHTLHGEPRDFSHLFADEFALVLQDKTHYPEAAESFRVIQTNAIAELLGELKADLANQAREQTSLDPVFVEQVFHDTPPDWFAQELQVEFEKLDRSLREIKTGVKGLHGEIQEFRSEMKARLPLKQDYSTLASHTPTETRSVMFAGSLETDIRFEDAVTRIKDKVSRRASRISDSSSVVPVSWDFGRSEREEAHDGDYAKSEAWTTLNDEVVGAVLFLGAELSRVISPDSRLLDQLDTEGWLASRDAGADVHGKFDDTLGMSERDRREFVRTRGGIEFSYETRFAAECMLRSIPLIVVQLTSCTDEENATAGFRKFLTENGIEIIDFIRLGRDMDWVGDFVLSLPGINEANLPNPYRGLDYYQVDDADAFTGRAREAAFAMADISLAVNDGKPMMLGVTGPSGCGKSSFMRARVAAEALEVHNLSPLEMRPTDFQWGENARVNCLPVLLAKIGSLIGVAPPRQFTGPTAPSPLLLQPVAIKWLDGLMNSSTPPPKLLICIDQFEEILDDLSEGVNENDWRALIRILRHLSQKFAWPLVFTLEDSRKERFADLKEDLGFQDSHMLELPDTDERFYRTLIEEPFRKSGIDLDLEIVDELIGEIRALQDDTSISASPLPLLSLRLYSLFHDLSPRAPKSAQDGRLGETFNRLRVTKSDLGASSLALGDMMADLAETAWIKGEGGDDEEDVGSFLRPLVRISIVPDQPEQGKLVLRSILARGYRSEQKLHDAFRRLRLLVPAAGGHRLVHEAVIRRWPKARAWFDADREDLAREANMRRAALNWDEVDRPGEIDPDEKQIEDAASVLKLHARDWSWGEVSHLNEELRLIREYALATFQYSKAPQKLVHKDKPRGAHVHVAASYGLDDLLKRFIEIEPDCVHNTQTKTGTSPLASAGWSHGSTVELLLENNANPANVDIYGFTDLDSAVWGEQDDILDLLLRHVDPSEWDEKRANPLGGAARRGRTDIAERLVRAGFCFNQRCYGGWAPIHQASLCDDVESFRYFWDKSDPSRKTDGGFTPLHIAAANGHVDLVEEILRHDIGAEMMYAKDVYGRTPVILAAWFTEAEMLAYLLPFVTKDALAVDGPTFEGFTPLHAALFEYYQNPESKPEHFRRRIFSVVKALLEDPDLDVSAKAKIQSNVLNDAGEVTAWEMAHGLPEVQRAIALHRNFPMELLKELRKADRIKQQERFCKELFDAAKAKNQSLFQRLLNRETIERQNLDQKIEGDSENISTGQLLLRNGWDKLFLQMVAKNHIDPWEASTKFPGLYLDALRNGRPDVIRAIEDLVPDSMPFAAAYSVLVGTRHDTKDRVKDPDDRVLKFVLHHLDEETATQLILSMSHFGDLDLIAKLKSVGGDSEGRDHWDRAYTDLLPDVARAEFGLEPAETTGSPRGDSLFYPDAEGWEPLGNPGIVAKLEILDNQAPADQVTWHQRQLPFYPGAEKLLLRATHPEWPDGAYIYYLSHGRNLYWLNGTSPPIHEFNAKSEIALTVENALEYLRFFCFFVRGEEGPFYVLDGREAMYIPTSLDRQEADSIHNRYKAPRLYGVMDNGHIKASSLIYYSNAVFVGDFVIHQSGMIELIEDEPVVSDLSQKVHAPLALHSD
ncbi:nSTAND1 domain-containing NTPase [Gymnodinialimonas hymeniacidonis]|uniref:nSTAND1 domain-containing NTPase n=1 Tax=Gymnodinialimonas hymeniacidonis TaxID=3126508 RepID=UPI0034C6B2CB